MKIIGISGKSGTGKDYISQNILRDLGYVQISLAWHFKVWLVSRGIFTYEEVFVSKPPHVRDALQKEGTEYGRLVYGENIWCQTLGTWMQVLSDNTNIDKFVIADMRFPNEVEYFQNMGADVYRIRAPHREAMSTIAPELRTHISETALDDYPFRRYWNNDPDDNITHQVRRDVGR